MTERSYIKTRVQDNGNREDYEDTAYGTEYHGKNKQENETYGYEDLSEAYALLKTAFDDLNKEYEEYRRSFDGISIDQVREYKELAYNDRKMGVKNKNSFNRDVKNTDMSRNSLIMLNISGMKAVNDRSRKEGDNVIKTVANCLKETVNGKGNVYRLIGDEFGIICGTGRNGCENMMNDTLSRLSEYNIRFVYGISTGSEGKSVVAMIDEADAYMKGMRQMNSLSREERDRLLNIQKNTVQDSVIVETRASKMQPVAIDNDDSSEDTYSDDDAYISEIMKRD